MVAQGEILQSSWNSVQHLMPIASGFNSLIYSSMTTANLVCWSNALFGAPFQEVYALNLFSVCLYFESDGFILSILAKTEERSTVSTVIPFLSASSSLNRVV